MPFLFKPPCPSDYSLIDQKSKNAFRLSCFKIGNNIVFLRGCFDVIQMIKWLMESVNIKKKKRWRSFLLIKCIWSIALDGLVNTVNSPLSVFCQLTEHILVTCWSHLTCSDGALCSISNDTAHYTEMPTLIIRLASWVCCYLYIAIVHNFSGQFFLVVRVMF